MKIIDLTLPLYDNMPVFEGDPQVEIKQVHSLEKEGWNLRTLFFTTHIGTHINVPIHMTKDGKCLDDYSIENFIGEARLYKSEDDVDPSRGIIFRDQNIDMEIYNVLAEIKPKFVGLSADFEFDIELEKKLLEKGIISYEGLTNLDRLPVEFTFYGIPLNIKDSDGSPVRAFATFNP